MSFEDEKGFESMCKKFHRVHYCVLLGACCKQSLCWELVNFPAHVFCISYLTSLFLCQRMQTQGIMVAVIRSLS